MKQPLLVLLDTFFKITASQFSIARSKESHPHAAAETNPGTKKLNEINVDVLAHYSAQDVVTAIRDLSFRESLTLLGTMSTESRHFILDALREHHDLKAALEFALDYHQSQSEMTPEHSEQLAVERIATSFLRRLAENRSLALRPPGAAAGAGLGERIGNVVPLARPHRPIPRTE